MEADLRARLTRDATIKAAVKASAIAWGDRPQASGLPGITLETIGGNRDQHMQDFQPIRGTLVQIDVWADDKLAAINLREAVIAALAPPTTVGATSFRRSFLSSEPVGSFENVGTAIVYRERIDFTIWHASAA